MQASKKKRNRFTPLEGIVIIGFLALFVLVVLVPFIVLLASSVSDSETLRTNGARPWVQNFSLLAFRLVFERPGDMVESYGISILVTVVGTILNLFLCMAVAYAISRPSFRYRKAVTFYFTFTIMFQAGFVPQYILYKNFLPIYNTLWVLILSPCVMVGHIIMLRAFYAAVPGELYEAARIDGANQYSVFFRIATPLIVPGIATIAFYSVLTYWNDPSTAMYFADDLTPVALYLARLSQYIEFLKFAASNTSLNLSAAEIPEDTLLYAVAVATTAPMLLIFTLFQKYFVGGLTSGAVKG